MIRDRNILLSGAIAAAVSALMMVVLAILPWPYEYGFPGEDVISGSLVLTTGLDSYVSAVQLILLFDTLFIIGWFISWLILGITIRKNYGLIGNAILITGLSGALLDFTENTIIWALIRCIQLDVIADSSWFIAWEVAVQLSYLLPFTSAILVLITLWSNETRDRVIAIMGISITLLAITGKFIPFLLLVSYAWFFLWFVFVCWYLWQQAVTVNLDVEKELQ